MQCMFPLAIAISILLNTTAAFAGHDSSSSHTSDGCFCRGKKTAPLKAVKGMHCGSCSSSSVTPLSSGSFDSRANSLSIGWFSSAVSQQLKRGQIEFSAGWLSPFTGGDAGGSGNQNYAGVIGWGVSDQLQLLLYRADSDDPLFVRLHGASTQVPNYWGVSALAARWQVRQRPRWSVSVEGAVETWQVKSGCGGKVNMFNPTDKTVDTLNLIGSIAMPVIWKIGKRWQFSVIPGVSFLPDEQGAGQGGAGQFYGTNFYVGVGLQWHVDAAWAMHGSVLMPLGPGYNQFDSKLEFHRVPVMSWGVTWRPCPRIGFNATLTNAFGATPSTGILTIPSSNVMGYSVDVQYNPWGRDIEQPALTQRDKLLGSGGLSVDTGVGEEQGATTLLLNADNQGNLFGSVGYSASNMFQFELPIGTFSGVPQTDALTHTFAHEGFNLRWGAKVTLMSPLRDDAFWLAARVTMGRRIKGTTSRPGYLFSELAATWQLSPRFALTVNPKFAWSGVRSPVGLGLGGNVQLSNHWQLLAEMNTVLSPASVNGTVGLRWLASKNIDVDAYLSNAAGLMDIGQLLPSGPWRVGGQVIISL